MDNPDLVGYIPGMAKVSVDFRNALLDEALWGSDALTRRSEELTPLYILRYTGPRTTCRYSRHEFWEFTYVFHGQGELIAQGCHVLKPGTAVLIPPGMDHYEQSPQTMDTLWVGLKGCRLDLDGLNRSRLLAGQCPELEPMLDRLWLIAERRFGCVGPEMDALSDLTLQQFIRLTRTAATTGLNVIDQAIGWLNRHFDRPLRVSELAQRFGFSEGYFHRAFKKHTGKSPIAYLTDLRVRHALHALANTTLTIDQIARLVGFRDPLYFSRIVRKTLGRSPREIRNKTH